MKILYLDCGMGAAGDMLMAALLELVPDREGFLARMNGLGLPGVTVEARAAEKQGLRGTHVAVRVNGREEDDHLPHDHEHQDLPHDHEHPHNHGHGDHPHDHGHPHDHEPHSHEHGDHTHDSSHHDHPHSHTALEDIRALLAGLPVPEAVRADALAVYQAIARAEAKAHGCPVDQVHFHEVGALDAVADVVGVCLLMAELAPDRVLASPVHVGSGKVRCAHGVLPVPAPATAELLRGIAIYCGAIQGELCTPTGAALLRHFVQEFGPMPPLRPLAWGHGMGTRDFPAANCLRALLGESLEEPEGQVWELACNLDDMTGEAVAFAAEELLAAGALDVWTAPIAMKKGRPGVLLSCLCAPGDRQRLTESLFRHTTTLGVRYRPWERQTLARDAGERSTPLGPVTVKRAWGHGVSREKAEYEDLARIARRQGLPLDQVRRQAEIPCPPEKSGS